MTSYFTKLFMKGQAQFQEYCHLNCFNFPNLSVRHLILFTVVQVFIFFQTVGGWTLMFPVMNMVHEA